MNNQISAYIVADHRERNGANGFLPAAIAANNDENKKLAYSHGGGELLFDIDNCKIGDYAILLPSKTNPSKKILAAVFERKTWKDMAASIKDQRIKHQHDNMVAVQKQTNCRAAYIIEGALGYKNKTIVSRIPFKNLKYMVYSKAFTGIPYFHTKNQVFTTTFLIDAARVLSKLYRQDRISFPIQESVSDENIEKKQELSLYMNVNIVSLFNTNVTLHPNNLLLKKISDIINNIVVKEHMFFNDNAKVADFCADVNINNLTNLQNIDIEHILTKYFNNYDEFADIRKQFELPSMSQMVYSGVEFLTKTTKKVNIIYNTYLCIPGIGDKTVSILIDIIPLIEIIQPKNKEETIRKIAKIMYPTGKSIGIGRATKIMSKTPPYAKILSQLIGVSKTTAEIVLKQYPPDILFSGKVKCDDIADIKKNNRRIGKRVGNAITEFIIIIKSKSETLLQSKSETLLQSKSETLLI